jgi:hypothetical protein
MPTVMRPAWVFADRAASEASGETVLNQNESTRVEHHILERSAAKTCGERR